MGTRILVLKSLFWQYYVLLVLVQMQDKLMNIPRWVYAVLTAFECVGPEFDQIDAKDCMEASDVWLVSFFSR